MRRKHHLSLKYLADNLGVIVGIVLVWRGVWYVLDAMDYFYLNGDHLISGIFGIVIGFIVLYMPDKDLKEIQKL